MALDVHGQHLVAGSVRDATPLSGGAAYMFNRQADGRWEFAGDLFPTIGTFQFAGTVRLWGTSAAIGSPGAIIGEEPVGAVEVFDLVCKVCRPDLDHDGALTLFDFLTFLNAFAAGDMLADFDGDGDLTLFDFLAFQTAFALGCP